MQKKRKGSCLKALLIFLFVIVLLLGGAVLLIKHFITGSSGDTVTTSFTAHNADEAIHQLEKLSDEFGYENALSELTEKTTVTVDGDNYYRLQQNYQGVPVYGKTVVCVTDENSEVISVTGNVVDIVTSLEVIPTASIDDVNKAINNFLSVKIGADATDTEIVSLNNDDLYIYSLDENLGPQLAYCLNWDVYEIVVDAHTAEVLFCTQTLYEEITSSVGYTASDINKDNGFSIEKRGEHYYVMSDRSRGLSVYTFNGRISKDDKGFWGDRATIVESTDVVFGNTEAERVLEYEEGAELLLNVTAIHDYFTSLGFSSLASNTRLYYNDGYDSGKNALGGKVDGNGVISMGAETGVYCIDVIAHEYTHFVSRELIGWVGNCENGALNEAMSDIFGEIIESKTTGNKMDWMMDEYRNIREPYLLGNPIVYKGVDWKETSNPTKDNDYGYVHSNSTVISHSAYLMWNGIDGNASKKIDTDMLAKLWYRAMLMMPADCDFSTCRQLVEWAALAIDGMTDTQRQCIADAFDAVGIYAPEQSPEILIDCDQNVVPDAVLNVYNVEGELHPQYTVEITGTIAEHELAYSTNIISDIGFSYEDTRTVRSAKSLHLDLPDGYYTFKITDKNNPQYEYIFTVSVSDQGTGNIIELHTDFEDRLLVHITGTESTEDKDETPLSIYEIAETATGLHCEWAVDGDFDDDGSDEIYALLCNSSSDYSNGQLWHFTSTENRCIFYIDEAEFEMICDIVKTIPDWLAAEIIDTVDNIDEFISDLERRYF